VGKSCHACEDAIISHTKEAATGEQKKKRVKVGWEIVKVDLESNNWE